MFKGNAYGAIEMGDEERLGNAAVRRMRKRRPTGVLDDRGLNDEEREAILGAYESQMDPESTVRNSEYETEQDRMGAINAQMDPNSVVAQAQDEYSNDEMEALKGAYRMGAGRGPQAEINMREGEGTGDAYSRYADEKSNEEWNQPGDEYDFNRTPEQVFFGDEIADIQNQDMDPSHIGMGALQGPTQGQLGNAVWNRTGAGGWDDVADTMYEAEGGNDVYEPMTRGLNPSSAVRDSEFDELSVGRNDEEEAAYRESMGSMGRQYMDEEAMENLKKGQRAREAAHKRYAEDSMRLMDPLRVRR